MTYRLESSYDTVQVLSPTLVSDALYCTITSFPSGSILQRTVPKTGLSPTAQAALLDELSVAVEGLISGGNAVSAVGTQGIDSTGLVFDAVAFTVQYVPPNPTGGQLTTVVEVPVYVLTADQSFASYIAGGNAVVRLQAAYDQLIALAGV